MGIITRQTPAVAANFTSDISPKLEPKGDASARALGKGNSTLMTQGIVAGQKLNLEYDGYFTPLPQDQGYGSATVTAHWQTKTAQGDSAPVQDSGWWGYGTQVPLDLPKDLDGPIAITFTETRKDGGVENDPTIYTADVMPTNAPTLKFSDNWENSVDGKLVKGGAFKVAYDIDRLRSQLNLSSSTRANMSVVVSFDGNYPTSKPLVYADALGEHVDVPEFRIPADASSVRIWFVGGPANGGSSSELKYDSDYGRNFTADIE